MKLSNITSSIRHVEKIAAKDPSKGKELYEGMLSCAKVMKIDLYPWSKRLACLQKVVGSNLKPPSQSLPSSFPAFSP